MRLMAYGRICHLGPTIYHRHIQPDHVRVVVEKAKDEDALVPLSTEEVQNVRQASNTFVSWPIRLVQSVLCS